MNKNQNYESDPRGRIFIGFMKGWGGGGGGGKLHNVKNDRIN